jgi:hypothetical protein
VFIKPLPRSGLHNSVVVCVYYLEMAVSVAQPFLRRQIHCSIINLHNTINARQNNG